MPKRYGKTKTSYLKTKSRLSPTDTAEIEKFRQFLNDKAVMNSAELMIKYREYMGFSEEEGAAWLKNQKEA